MSDSRNDIRGDSIKYTKRLSNQEDLHLEVSVGITIRHIRTVYTSV